MSAVPEYVDYVHGPASLNTHYTPGQWGCPSERTNREPKRGGLGTYTYKECENTCGHL